MAEIEFPSRKEYDGPWLISKKNLEELNSIIEEIWNDIEQSTVTYVIEEIKNDHSKNNARITNKNIKQDVEKKIIIYKDREILKKQIIVKIKKDKQVKFTSINDILKDPLFDNVTIIGFTILLESIGIKIELTLSEVDPIVNTVFFQK